MQHIVTYYKQLEKPDNMPDMELKQLQFESDIWKRLLGFIMDENVHMKNRISEILKNGFNKNLLDEVERFQSRFIKEDELIGLLRNEVAEFDKLLVKEIFKDGKIKEDINRRLKKLSNNIIITERQFGKLQTEFSHYLSEMFNTGEYKIRRN